MVFPHEINENYQKGRSSHNTNNDAINIIIIYTIYTHLDGIWLSWVGQK